MRIQSLEAFGVHRDLLDVWESHYGSDLLPVQTAAVSEAGVLRGDSVVVYAPTGAGKTFIGEMAAVRAATQGQRAVYLVPTKALAEEKYSLWVHTYGPLGVRIIISTRDRRGGDRNLVSGDFDVAISVPEKLRFLLSQSPQMARHIGCIVVDELQLVGDPNRGLCLEVLLAQLLSRARHLQIVGLSAVIDKPEQLADWLGAQPLCIHQRPLELRKGVLAGGIFRYQEHNSGQLGEEDLRVDPEGLSLTEAMTQLGCWFAERREPTLIFLRDKATTVRLAHRLAEAASLPPAEQTLEHLTRLTCTSARNRLIEFLSVGVAFHNADLQFEERQALEAGFASGEIGLLCSTSTLGMGVNLPAKNVIVDPYQWEHAPGGRRPLLVPISRADFENMGGRAGRLRLSDDFGRAILLADTQFMQATMFDRYVSRGFDPVTPALAQQPPLRQVLALCATGHQATEADLAKVYQHTFAAHQQSLPDAHTLPPALRSVAQAAVDCGLLHRSSITSRLTVTPQGHLCSASGLSLSGFRWISYWVEASAGQALSDLAALVVAASAPDARALLFPVRPAEASRYDFVTKLHELGGERGEATQILEQILAAEDLTAYQHAQAARLALVMLQWASSEPTLEIEQATQLPAGRLQLCAETVGWLLQIISQIGERMNWPATDCARLSRWADRIAAGLPAAGLELYHAAHRLLDRDHILSLLAAGVDNWAVLLSLPAEQRGKLLPHIDLDQLPSIQSPAPRPTTLVSYQSVTMPHQPISPSQPQYSEPILRMDKGRPDQVIFRGSEIYLRPAEYKLLRALASQPRRCVSYHTLYNEIWGPDEIVESAQVHWHRHKLVKKLRAANGGSNGTVSPIKTIPRRGYILDLDPRQVEVK